MTSGIYIIINKDNGHCYVGSAKSIAHTATSKAKISAASKLMWQRRRANAQAA